MSHYKNSSKQSISAEEIEELKNAVSENELVDYAVACEFGVAFSLEMFEDAKIENPVRYIAVYCDDTIFCAIDDGTEPRLTKLIDKYLDTVLVESAAS